MWKESIRKSVLNQRTINYEFKKLSDFVNNSETQSRFKCSLWYVNKNFGYLFFCAWAMIYQQQGRKHVYG